jgi:hypothetical protein
MSGAPSVIRPAGYTRLVERLSDHIALKCSPTVMHAHKRMDKPAPIGRYRQIDLPSQQSLFATRKVPLFFGHAELSGRPVLERNAVRFLLETRDRG